jgi:transposase
MPCARKVECQDFLDQQIKACNIAIGQLLAYLPALSENAKAPANVLRSSHRTCGCFLPLPRYEGSIPT